MNQKINYNLSEITSFFKYFDIENSKTIKFSDFGKAFLPGDKDLALKILSREPRNIKREKSSIDDIFQKQTIVQYMLLWRIILRQMFEIEEKKKRYCQSNFFNAERIFFEIDHLRKGYIDKSSVMFISFYFT